MSDKEVERRAGPAGSLFIIGGGLRSVSMMRAYIDLCGGVDAPVVIVPFASTTPVEQGERMKQEMQSLGCTHVTVLDRTLASPSVDEVRSAAGIYFIGGDQSRLRDCLTGTSTLAAIRKAYERGAVVGGTSAGAAVMSRVMLSGNELQNPGVVSPDEGDAIDAFSRIQLGNIETTEGFGFLEGCVVDQHFVRRKRENRLISVVLEHPDLLGIGIDESTAIIVAGGRFEVLGKSCVIVLDDAHATDVGIGRGGSLRCVGLTMHVLTEGQRFDLATRTVMPSTRPQFASGEGGTI
ncbi:cyanophycinase [Candidatus Cryosericum odellii]|uniref:Cyanophycinase n=1 Tax=Candidatus Cryosericum odellii TaxID=2290917 RepID=A0A398DGD8_9BACT|nr:cyanophycinase [Candidatus Cryosericum odellii]RIE11267.1 cyanophycinase [Candidatus Cryosericum odellii]